MEISSRGSTYNWVTISIESLPTIIQENIAPNEAEDLINDLECVINDLKELIGEEIE